MSRAEDFGQTINGSRWFNREPNVKKDYNVRPVAMHWECPMDGCDGEMRYVGMDWPTSPMGHHHECNVCHFRAAIPHRKFPYIEFEEK